METNSTFFFLKEDVTLLSELEDVFREDIFLWQGLHNVHGDCGLETILKERM